MTAIQKSTKAYVETEIDGEKVLMSLGDGRFFSLAGPGLAIWDAIDGARDRAAIVDELCATYDAPRDTIEADLDAFLESLAEAGLITEV